jgi:MoaA/NifB/PqqE/SkfB family radical SAM enzyme
MSIKNRMKSIYKSFKTRDRNFIIREVGRILRLKSHLEMSLLGGYALPPYSVSLWLTRNCNLNCSFCWVKQDTTEIDISYYYKLIDEIARYSPRIGITGGEPLLYKGCLNLIRYIKAKDIKAGLNTNGILLKKYARELIETGIDNISISIDGPPEIHDEIRGVKGAFKLTETGSRKLLELRKNSNADTPKVRALITLCRKNLPLVEKTIETLDGWGFDSIILQHLWFSTEELATENQQQLQKIFDVSTNYLSQFIVGENLPDGEDVVKTIDVVRSLETDTPIHIHPHLSDDELLIYYNEPHTQIIPYCHSRWLRVEITPEGDVTPCMGYVVGNIKEEPFMKLWNNEKFRNFRRKLEKKGTFPGCYRCCGLFSDL